MTWRSLCATGHCPKAMAEVRHKYPGILSEYSQFPAHCSRSLGRKMDSQPASNAHLGSHKPETATAYQMVALGQHTNEASTEPLLRDPTPTPSDAQRRTQRLQDDYPSDHQEPPASHQSLDLPFEQDRTEEQPPSNNKSPNRRRNHVGAWLQEILCCGISVVALIVLVVILNAYNGKPLPDWPSGITINAVVALLSTISRTAFLIPVAEGLSQCKWNWFKLKARPLKDFDLFDQASRGPWGSLSLLTRTKGW